MHKIKRFPIYFTITLGLFFHLTMSDRVELFGARPDVMLLTVVFFAVFLGSARGMEIGLAAGALKDLFGLDTFGINAFIFCLTGFLVGAVNDKLFKESRATQVFLVFIFTNFSMALHFMGELLLSKSANMGFAEYIFIYVLPSSVYTAIAAIPIFFLLANIFGLKEREAFL